jgi:hypothetical protein
VDPLLDPTKGFSASLRLLVYNSPSAMDSTAEGSVVLLTLPLFGEQNVRGGAIKRRGAPRWIHSNEHGLGGLSRIS